MEEKTEQQVGEDNSRTKEEGMYRSKITQKDQGGKEEEKRSIRQMKTREETEEEGGEETKQIQENQDRLGKRERRKEKQQIGKGKENEEEEEGDEKTELKQENQEPRKVDEATRPSFYTGLTFTQQLIILGVIPQVGHTHVSKVCQGQNAAMPQPNIKVLM